MNASACRMVIVGASGHGIVALDAARKAGHEVLGFLDSYKPAGHRADGVPVLGHPDQLAALMVTHGFRGVFLAISDNWTRKTVYERLRAAGTDFELVSIIHPQSAIATTAQVGAGTLVLAGAVINANARVGVNCIINTKASLDHDGEMHPYSSLLPGVTTGGNCVIGECACVCIGATLSHRVTIGEHTVVGAGSVVLNDVPSHVLAYGVPLRVVRPRQTGERHF